MFNLDLYEQNKREWLEMEGLRVESFDLTGHNVCAMILQSYQ